MGHKFPIFKDEKKSRICKSKTYRVSYINYKQVEQKRISGTKVHIISVIVFIGS